jgi:putative flippase GtrA
MNQLLNAISAKFAVASGFSFLANLGCTIVLTEYFGWEAALSFGISLIFVSFLYFMVCRKFVFQSTQKSLRIQLFSFYRSWIIFRSIEYLVFLLLYAIEDWYYMSAIVIVQTVSTIGKFLVWKSRVF